MKQEDLIIYACTIIGAGVGLSLGSAFPGAVIGIGAGFLLKTVFKKENE